MPSKKLIGSLAMTAALAGGGVIGATLGNPLTVTAQTVPSTTTTPAAGAGAPDGPGRHRLGAGVELDAAAKALGMTVDDLKAEIKAGKTLAAIAEEKGVPKQDLIDALVAAASARLDELKASLPERMANLVDRQLPDGPRGHRGPFGERPGLEAAAKVLGLSVDDLRTALRDGTSLADVAKEKGVDVQKVTDALVAEAKTKLADAVTSGELTQDRADEISANLTERITAMVNGEGPMGRMRDHFGPDDADPADGGN